MKTIGSRLTRLYLFAVTGTILAMFLLGRFVLEHQVRENIDALLEARFAELSDRFQADPDAEAGELSALLPAQGPRMPFYATVTDRWNDPAYRSARLRGETPAENSKREFYDSVREGGEEVRVIEGNAESRRIRIATPMSPLLNARRAYTEAGLALVGAALAASLVAGRLLSRSALRPVRLIRETAARISSDNLSERIPIAGVQDEITGLSQLLNETFDRLEASFEQIKRFSEDASHELKTPLSLIRLNVERLVGRETLTSQGREALHDAIEEIHRLDALIERLLFLSRAQAGEVRLALEEQDPRPFISGFSHDAQVLAEASEVAYIEEANESGRVRFDAGHIRQVLFNLLSNALRATPAGGRVALRSEFRGEAWRVTLEDDGPGLPAENCSRIFDRFVRVGQAADPARARGAGLGLAICRSIIGLHRGTIVAEPREGGRGLRLVFEVPLAQRAAP